MSTILDLIVANRRAEVLKQRQEIPLRKIQSKIDLGVKRNSLVKQLQIIGVSGIIAEFKRQSPSKGVINEQAEPEIVTKGYASAGASGLSVLTEGKYFGGSISDFTAARHANLDTPLLRKDFMVAEYQLYESRLLNADVILLIASVLGKAEISRFTAIAHELGMEVLLELHDEGEISKIDKEIDMIGINNRNLKDFKVDIDRSLKMLDRLSEKSVKISESGISNPETVDFMRKRGFQGFLMGEIFMKSQNPEVACQDFISKLKF